MTANPILLQKKYSRVIECFAKQQGLSLDAALDFFYHSQVYQLIHDGVSDMHCMSDAYLAEELKQEYAEKNAGFMHKYGICEERGSGYDKIVEATGKNELLAPRIENQNNQFTKAILFAKVPFELTSKEDRMRTCYMQACLAYVNFEGISNSDIRKIFGLEHFSNTL